MERQTVEGGSQGWVRGVVRGRRCWSLGRVSVLQLGKGSGAGSHSYLNVLRLLSMHCALRIVEMVYFMCILKFPKSNERVSHSWKLEI